MNCKMNKSFHNSFREQVDGSACRALAVQAQRHEFKPQPPHTASCTSVMPVFLWRDGRWKQQTLCKPEGQQRWCVQQQTRSCLKQGGMQGPTPKFVLTPPCTLTLIHLHIQQSKNKEHKLLKSNFSF